MYKLAYIIPTKGRPECLDECLNAMNNSFLNYDVAVYIMDGNENDLSYNVYKKYEKRNIFYEKRPDLDGDERSFLGIKIADSQYVCLWGDACLAIPESAKYVMDLLDKDYDLFELTPRDNKHIGEKEYTDIVEMFGDCAWDSTMSGTVFFKKSSYRDIDYTTILDNYSCDGFFHIAYYYDLLKENIHFKGLYCPKFIFNISKYKVSSSWFTKESFLEIWGKEWSKTINALDPKFDKYKKQVILDHGLYGLGLNSIIQWLRFKNYGLLDKNSYAKYKNEIKQITNVDIRYIFLICNMPDCLLIPVRVMKAIKLFFKQM